MEQRNPLSCPPRDADHRWSVRRHLVAAADLLGGGRRGEQAFRFQRIKPVSLIPEKLQPGQFHRASNAVFADRCIVPFGLHKLRGSGDGNDARHAADRPAGKLRIRPRQLPRFDAGAAPVITATLAIPVYLVLIPLFQLGAATAQLNTQQFVILVLVSASLPLAIWILRSHIASLPQDIEAAALGPTAPTRLS